MHAVIYIICDSSFAVLPTEYITSWIRPFNGSSPHGHCSRHSAEPYGIEASYESCRTPSTSVLFDGYIPATLPGLHEGHAWAFELLTLQPSSLRDAFSYATNYPDYDGVPITFKFSSALRMGEVEVVLFNCPEWDISITSLALYGVSGVYAISGLEIVGYTSVSNSSCDRLTTVHLDATLSDQQFSSFMLLFGVSGSYTWVDIAEVALYTQENATVTLPGM